MRNDLAGLLGRPEFGRLERIFDSPSRAESFGVGMLTLFLCVVFFAVAAIFDGTWVVVILGMGGLVSGFMAVFHLLKTVSADPVVGVFERGILIKRTFLPVSEIKRVDHSSAEVDHHHGLKTHCSLWVFQMKNGRQRRLLLNHIFPAGDYLPVDDFNSLLRSKGIEIVGGD